MRHSFKATAALALLLVPGVAFADVRSCFGDLDGDGEAGLADLALLLAAYDTCDGDPFYDPDADLDESGCVDLADLASLLAVYGTTCPVGTELAGNSLDQYPFFEYVRAFNEDATVEIAIDPTRFPEIVGRTADIYVVVSKTAAEWSADPSLVDITGGGPQTEIFGGTTIQDNTFGVTGAHELDADAGIGLGVGYDIVLDINQDGELGAGDYIDGLGDEAGLYAVHDTTQPGPLAVTEVVYSGGTWLGQDTFYPTEIGDQSRRRRQLSLVPSLRLSPGLVRMHRDEPPEQHWAGDRERLDHDADQYRLHHCQPGHNRRRRAQRAHRFATHRLDRSWHRWRGGRAGVRPSLRRRLYAGALQPG
jgi:hypothetical protein